MTKVIYPILTKIFNMNFWSDWLQYKEQDSFYIVKFSILIKKGLIHFGFCLFGFGISFNFFPNGDGLKY